MMTSSNDLLAAMPIEIQDKILDYFSLRERIRISRVNKNWYSMVLNAPGTFQGLSLTASDEKIEPDIRPYKTFIKQDAVKKIYIGGDENNTTLFDFLVSLHCNKINDASIMVQHLTGLNASKFIGMCGNALTEIDLRLGTFPPPDVFIRSCPNLKCLVFDGGIENPREYQPSALLVDVKHQHLTDLAIEIANIEGHLDITAILNATPKLKYLNVLLSNIAHTCMLLPEQLLKLCPELGSLILGGIYDVVDLPDLQETESIQHNPSEQAGVTKLYFDDNSDEVESVPTTFLCQLVSLFHDTLQILDLHAHTRNDVYGPDMIRHMSYLPFPFLRQLNLGWDVRTWIEDDILHRFFRNTVSNLTSLYIVQVMEHLDDEILELIAKHAFNLQEIGLANGSYSSSGLQQFLLDMAHPERTLRKVDFDQVEEADLQVLCTIATSRLCVINEMRFHSYYASFVDEIEEFLDNMLQAGKRMKFLHLNFDPGMDGVDFANSKRGKAIIEKVNCVSDEFNLKIYRFKEITHVEYRDTI